MIRKFTGILFPDEEILKSNIMNYISNWTVSSDVDQISNVTSWNI